jgi:hypothetical protein
METFLIALLSWAEIAIIALFIVWLVGRVVRLFSNPGAEKSVHENRKWIFIGAVLIVILGLRSFNKKDSNSQANSNEITVVKSENKTSADIPVKFKLERTEWSIGLDKLQVWGTVTNSGGQTYKYVTVVFSAYDASRKFLGRNTEFAEPTLIKPGQVGYVNGFLDTAKEMPSELEYNVTVQ